MTALSITREIFTRDEVSWILNMADADFRLWLDPQVAADYKSGKSPIPQMPHIPGRPVKFHLPTLREWRLKYFLRGGESDRVTNGRRNS